MLCCHCIALYSKGCAVWCYKHSDLVMGTMTLWFTSAKINISYSILFNLTTSYSSYFGGKKGISRNKTSFFLLMFSEQQSQRLPEHTVWDHAIELLPGAPASLPGRLLRLSQNEIKEISKIVAEHLQRGTIRPGIGPYAANVFCVKKKDGKLCPVQDYRPVKKWTKKNRNVSPLIPQVVDQLTGCTLFTKFDIRWGYNNI